ncbi:MAG: response regulator [Deltaproteobacteria bacterium]|nr:MAG: response regulator [Deltaproteobacteria bacterium]
MTVKLPPKLKSLEKDIISFSLRQTLKPLIKIFSEKCETHDLILHFDIPIHIPDTLVGNPQHIKNTLTRTFNKFLKKSLDSSEDEILHGGIQMETKRDPEGHEKILLTFIFESLTDLEEHNSPWINDHCSFILAIDPLEPLSAEKFSSINQTIDLSNLKCLAFTTPTLYSSLVSILNSWKVPVQIFSEIPKNLPDHDVILITDQVGSFSGFEVSQIIKNRHPRSLILFVSSHPQRGDAALCRDLGIQSYLSYPIQPIELWEAIKRLVHTPRSSANFSELITKHSLREEEARLNILLIPSGDMDTLELSEIGGLLLSHGHRVTMITSPEEMRKLPFSGQFDLVVTDSERKEQLQFQQVTIPIVTFDSESTLGESKDVLGDLLERIEHLN